MINLRKIGRELLSPHEIIINLIDDYIGRNNIDLSLPILDFGSGTLLYSEKFYKKYNIPVYAYDISYKKSSPKTNIENIKIYSDYDKVMNNKFALVFTCDVLHHVNKNSLLPIMEKFTEVSDCVIIKDVDCADKLGYLQSKIHDLIISHQIINDIYANDFENFLIIETFQLKFII